MTIIENGHERPMTKDDLPKLHAALVEGAPESRATAARCAEATGSLPALEAEALATEWLNRAVKCNQRNVEATKAGATALALAYSVRSAAYLVCADELRQRMALSIQRQPEENT